MAELDGPRLEPRSGTAKQLVVFLHGYGADGNDLIDLGRAWQEILPDTAFVSPHAPEPCGQAPVGRQRFELTFLDPDERWVGVNKAAPVLDAFLDQELERRKLPKISLGAHSSKHQASYEREFTKLTQEIADLSANRNTHV